MAKVQLTRVVKSGGKWHEPGTIVDLPNGEGLIAKGAAIEAPEEDGDGKPKKKGKKKPAAELDAE